MDRLKWWRKVTAVSNPTAAVIVSIGASYSDAVDRMVAAQRRERLLGLIPSGTAFGVLVAGPLALVTQGTAWRHAWLILAACAGPTPCCS